MIKEITSAEANKYIRRLEDDKRYLLSIEADSCTYIAPDGAYDVPIPEYDYKDIAKKIDVIDTTIRKIKHAINQFNCKTQLPESEITIDQALVMMAQLNQKKNRLDTMRKTLPKSRVDNFISASGVVEYKCTNYDLEDVKNDYEKVSDKISELQMGIDFCNQTMKLSIEF